MAANKPLMSHDFNSISVRVCLLSFPLHKRRPPRCYIYINSISGVTCVMLTCCVMAKPMTGSPSGMSHVTTAEFAFTALMVTLTGGDKLSANRQRGKQKLVFISCGTRQMRSSAPLCSAETATSLAGGQVQRCE